MKTVALLAALTAVSFGKLPDGRTAHVYTLGRSPGIVARISDYGGVLVSLQAPDRRGAPADIVLGYDDVAGYLADTQTYFGALIGRYANRIADGRFTLDGHRYTLAINNPPNSLHGGKEGFNRKLWTARDASRPGVPALELTYTSPDGEEGYPGRLSVRVVYSIRDGNTLRIEYTASTDRDTVVNLTNHSYFNLSGAGAGDVLATQLHLFASHYTPVNANLIPTGQIAPVAGTPLDFTTSTAIGARINQKNPQLEYAHGYDFNYVIDGGGKGKLVEAADAYDPNSGRELRVFTTQPGLQLYTGNFLDGTIRGKGGKVYIHRGAFALETQHFPDSPNQPGFPSTELKPGQTYHQITVYRFTARSAPRNAR